MMRSASRRALQELREERERIVGDGVDGETLTTLAQELYSVGNLLAGQPRLRRTLGDPATAPEARADFVQQLFGSRLSDRALALVKAAVTQRWSSPWDLSDALEGTGDDALFVAAEQDGSLDQVEDELFRFGRILENDGELSALLDEYAVGAERRVSLLDSLLEGKVTRSSLTMLRHAVRSERKRSLVLAVDDLLERAAALQERSIARVVSARPITDAQQERLAEALSAMYNRRISVRSAVDPDILGGLIVRVGHEVIDGSIATRLATARSDIAG